MIARTLFLIAWLSCWLVPNSWGQLPGDVPLSPAWDVAASPHAAGIGGADVAPRQGDGWTMAYHPAAMDTTVPMHIHVANADFLGMHTGAAILPLPHRNRRSSHVGVRFASYGEFQRTLANGQSDGTFSGGDYIAQYGTAWAIDSLWHLGITGWLGARNLERVTAGVAGADFGIVRRSRNGLGAVGVLLSNVGLQEDFSGIMPEGRLPHHLQIGLTQGFPNAPFTFHLRLQRLETWNLAPEGTYDDGFDPLTGEVIPNDTWVWGDQLARHIAGGVSLKLGPHLRGYMGYNHHVQTSMVAAGRPGLTGMSFGMRGKFRWFDYSIARSNHHLAGKTTHLGLIFGWPESVDNSGASASKI